MNLLCISREKKIKQILSMRGKFSFPYVDIYFDVPILKNSDLKYWCVSAFFVAETYNYRLRVIIIIRVIIL